MEVTLQPNLHTSVLFDAEFPTTDKENSKPMPTRHGSERVRSFEANGLKTEEADRKVITFPSLVGMWASSALG